MHRPARLEDSSPSLTRDVPKAKLVLLQSLRGIAALMVVLCHVTYWWRRHTPEAGSFPIVGFVGEAGVDLFFVISGFIMMHITPAAHRSWRDQIDFLFRRFMRIYPAYWAVAAVLFVVWLKNPYLLNQFEGNKIGIWNSVFLYPSQYDLLLIVSWTLVCELTFYVISSFIFYTAGATRLALVFLWGGIILGTTMLLPRGYFHHALVQGLLIPNSLEFIAGMVLAYFLMRGVRRISPWIALGVIVLSVAAMVTAVMVHGSYFVEADQPVRVAVYGLPSLLIVWVVLQMDIQGNWQGLTWLAPVGDRSYSLYLIHYPVITVVFRVLVGYLGHSLFALAAIVPVVAVVLLISTECLYRGVERPSHQWARAVRFSRPRA